MIDSEVFDIFYDLYHDSIHDVANPMYALDWLRVDESKKLELAETIFAGSDMGVIYTFLNDSTAVPLVNDVNVKKLLVRSGKTEEYLSGFFDSVKMNQMRYKFYSDLPGEMQLEVCL